MFLCCLLLMTARHPFHLQQFKARRHKVGRRRVDRITFRSTTAQPGPAFHVDADRYKVAYLNGRRSSIVMPKPYTLIVRDRNASGRITGTFFFSYGFDVWTDVPVGFTTARHKIELLPFEGYQINRAGVVVGIKRAGDDESMNQDNYQNPNQQPHGWVWLNGKPSDIGLANDVRFMPRTGSIEGYYVCDKDGTSVETVEAKMLLGNLLQLHFREFKLVNGKRVESKTLLIKPPFKGPGYSDWFELD